MNWLGLLIIAFVLVGHLALMRMLITGVYRTHLPKWIRPVRLGIVSLIAVGLAWLMLHEAGPGLCELRWTAIPLPWLLYSAICVLAVPIGLARLLVRAAQPQPGLLSDQAEYLHAPPDVAAAARSASMLARFPGNQVLELEITQKELAVPRLPSALDRLSILHISDLHYNGTPGVEFFEWAIDRAMRLRPDLVALTGDIIDDPDLMFWIERTLGPVSAAGVPLGCWFVMGNHDALEGPEPIRAEVARIGWNDLGAKWRTISHDGQSLLIAGTEVPWIQPRPDLADAPRADFRLLLSHSPRQLRWAAQNDFDLMLAGHVHGGQIRLPLLGPVHGASYDCGMFQHGQTLLHVSRGLAQLTPIRLRCRPEITKLTLRKAKA